VRVYLVGGTLCLSAALSCTQDTTLGLTPASLEAVPSIMVIPVGGTQSVIVSAFESGTNPVDASWSIGAVGPGITVKMDTLFGRVFQGNQLVQPTRSHSRRFLVTLTADQSSTFVVSADASVLTIPVDPATP
jgi:hypothetical protein